LLFLNFLLLQGFAVALLSSALCPLQTSGDVQAPFRLCKVALLGGLACLCATDAQAQVVAVGELRAVIISGSRTEQVSDELPASIDVINAKDLEEGQIRDIRDAAKNLPNVSVKRAPARFGPINGSTGRDGNAGFNIRGLDGNRVLLLVDGVRSPRSYVFGASAFGRDYFDVSLLKRIEIVRGPASALYGSDGVAGLVNFITLEPLDFLTGGKAIGGRASASHDGDNRGLTLAGSVAGRVGESVDWLLSASVNRTNGVDNLGSNNASNLDRTTPNPERGRANGLLAKMVIRPTPSQKHVVTLEHIGKNTDYDLLTSRARLPLVGTVAAINNAVVNATSFTQMERDRLSWDARYKLGTAVADSLQTALRWPSADSREFAFEDRNVSPDRTRDVTYSERSVQLNVQAAKMLDLSKTWSQKITYGFDYSTANIANLVTGIVPPAGETFPLKRFPDTTESSSAVYAQSEFASDLWSITPGVRVDRFKLKASQSGFTPLAASLSGKAASPKLGVLYRATSQWSIFANYAGGFKAPNANQLNGFFENATQFYKTVSNPKLKPETSRNLELGVRGRLEQLTLDVAAFTGQFNDLIEDNRQVGGAGVPGNPTVFQSVNIGKATISGFEVKGNVAWGAFAGGKLSSPFTYGQTRGSDSTTGLPLNSIDPRKLVLGLKFETPGWDARIDLSHHAAKTAGDIDSARLVNPPATQFTVPSATTLDVSGQWRFSKAVRLNASINNLTNRKYWNWSEVAGVSSTSPVIDAYTQPGRYVKVSLVADF
jgi:hemoglobin/transferrin/lactoferrin receptor protein